MDRNPSVPYFFWLLLIQQQQQQQGTFLETESRTSPDRNPLPLVILDFPHPEVPNEFLFLRDYSQWNFAIDV
jgi:hypothetical protein